MTGVWIVLAVGTILIVFDWMFTTSLDPRTKRWLRLKAEERRRVFDKMLWTLALAVLVWAVPNQTGDRATALTGAWIALAIGALLIVSDWMLSTPPDPKTKRRPRLKPEDRERLFDMMFWTIGLAVAAWAVPKFF